MLTALNIGADLTVEEIKTGKEILKELVLKQIKLTPNLLTGAEEFSQLLIDLADTIADEKIIKELLEIIKLVVPETMKLEEEELRENPQSSPRMGKITEKAIQNLGLRDRISQLAENFANHLEQLAPEGTPPVVNPTITQTISEKITQMEEEIKDNPPLPSPNDEDAGLVSLPANEAKRIFQAIKKLNFNEVKGALTGNKDNNEEG